MTRPLTAAERQRLRTPANLWRALIPLLAIVGLLVLFAWPRGQHSRRRARGRHRRADRGCPQPGRLRGAGPGRAGGPVAADLDQLPSRPGRPAAPASGSATSHRPASTPSSSRETTRRTRWPPSTARSARTAPSPCRIEPWDRYRTSDGHLLLRHTVNKVTVHGQRHRRPGRAQPSWPRLQLAAAADSACRWRRSPRRAWSVRRPASAGRARPTARRAARAPVTPPAAGRRIPGPGRSRAARRGPARSSAPAGRVLGHRGSG